ncbi:MAG: cyclopropane-fatty-acyl-phospholipid synthase family protein [Candidatus Sumerlaeia bacterium]|nr:cyclopropane-fatty-acyl-phospholipid synthase family protein [Candidatus Sumerlaeia bacterium]
MSIGVDLAERGLVPDSVITWGIRRRCAEILKEHTFPTEDAARAAHAKFIAELRASPLAIHTDKANEQHYEVPPPFFLQTLGKRLKYSCCFYDENAKTLDQAEERMLALYGERGELADGQEILELGCGWGSLTLWMAEKYPNARILSLSNSRPQREFIEQRARANGFNNVQVVTQDVNLFDTSRRFDRIVSIEMFEHLRNYEELTRKLKGWMKPGGKAFVHIFCHNRFGYPYVAEGEDNWMAKHFFTGGLMPSFDIFRHFEHNLVVEQDWQVPGWHYEKTSWDWLRNMDENREEIRGIFRDLYGPEEADRWLQRWRIFFMSCAELFGYDKGTEWIVGHYRMRAAE